MARKGRLEVFGMVTDIATQQRLVLRFVAAVRPRPSGVKGYNFHSLTWQAKDGRHWKKKRVISQEEFESGSEFRRWVSSVHSLNSGRAILQLGEEGRPNKAGVMRVTYFWCEWDLATNRQVRVIRVCKDSFELFEQDDGTR